MDDRAVNTNGNGKALMGFEQFGSNMMWGRWSVSLLGSRDRPKQRWRWHLWMLPTIRLEHIPSRILSYHPKIYGKSMDNNQFFLVHTWVFYGFLVTMAFP